MFELFCVHVHCARWQICFAVTGAIFLVAIIVETFEERQKKTTLRSQVLSPGMKIVIIPTRVVSGTASKHSSKY